MEATLRFKVFVEDSIQAIFNGRDYSVTDEWDRFSWAAVTRAPYETLVVR